MALLVMALVVLALEMQLRLIVTFQHGGGELRGGGDAPSAITLLHYLATAVMLG